jgi:hypothetical protein
VEEQAIQETIDVAAMVAVHAANVVDLEANRPTAHAAGALRVVTPAAGLTMILVVVLAADLLQ